MEEEAYCQGGMWVGSGRCVYVAGLLSAAARAEGTLDDSVGANLT